MSYDTLTADQRLFLTKHLTALQLVVVIQRINGHSWQRIANSMDLDEATVRGHYKRGQRRLSNAHRTQEETTT